MDDENSSKIDDQIVEVALRGLERFVESRREAGDWEALERLKVSLGLVMRAAADTQDGLEQETDPDTASAYAAANFAAAKRAFLHLGPRPGSDRRYDLSFRGGFRQDDEVSVVIDVNGTVATGKVVRLGRNGMHAVHFTNGVTSRVDYRNIRHRPSR